MAGLGIFWSLGGPGYPYCNGTDHQGPSLSILGDLPPASVSSIITAWGVVGALVAVLMARRIEQPAAVAPELLWLIWGVALAAAAVDSYYRRRGTCAHCGQR